jgi:two-component system sensor histidine kinase/response regulator
MPIIILSADSASRNTKRSAGSAFLGYGVKPVKRAELLQLVRQALNLPSTLDSPVARNGSGARNDLIGDAIRILVADDCPDNRVLMQAYFRGSPHTVTFAEDGAAAVDAFTSTHFDLILMDVQMPKMDGLTATRKIRATEADQHRLVRVPILALSANARPEDGRLSRDAGCNGHLTKPISKSGLFCAIKEYGSKMKPSI